MVERSAPKSTRTQEVYEELWADLLNARFAPAEKLQAPVLSKRFGVSLSVVREALTRLSERGLVVQTPQRGFRVAELSEADLADLTQVRVQIETLAVREAMARGDVAWETRVVATHYALERTPVTTEDGSINELWAERHREFHEALLEGCGSPRLLAFASTLRQSSETYRRWYWHLVPHGHRDFEKEHRTLRDLILARDAEAAAKALADHIAVGPKLLAELAADQADGATDGTIVNIIDSAASGR